MPIYFKTQGKGLDIVLLHGWGFNSDIWQPITKELIKKYRVTVMDFPGYGRSQCENDKEYNLNYVVENVLHVVPKDPAVFVGWSLGGLVATQIGLLHPEHVIGIVNVASSPKFIATENWPGMTLDAVEKFAEELQADYHALLQRFLALQGLHQDEIESIKKVLLRFGNPDQNALLAGLEILKYSDFRSCLKQMDESWCYILCRLDRIVPFAVKEKILELNQQINVRVINGGHAFFLSKHKEFINHLNEFVTCLSLKNN